MFGEYLLRPDAQGKILFAAFSSLASWLMALGILWGYLICFEPDSILYFKMVLYYISVFFVLAGGIVSFNTYRKLKSFRMISTDDGLEIKTGGGLVNVRYDAIARIVRLPRNILTIYTTGSSRTPVIAISDMITNREQLDRILQQFLPYEESNKLPFSYTKYARPLAMTLFLSVTLLHFAVRNTHTMVGAGILLITMLMYTLIVRFPLRREIPFTGTLIVVLFIFLLVGFRILRAFHPEYFQ